MRIKNSFVSVCLTLLIIGKSLVPAGYMLNSYADATDSGYLSLCPLQNPGLNLGVLQKPGEHDHSHYADSSSHTLDDLPSDSYNPTSGLTQCVLWQNSGTFPNVLSIASYVIPNNEPAISLALDIPYRSFRFCCNAPRAPPSFLS